MALERLQINESVNILDTLRFMDENQTKYLIAVNETGVVIGTLSDGDIRRAIIRGCSLEEPISLAVNHSFMYVLKTDSIDKILSIFHERKIEFIPILDENKKLYNVMTRHILNYLLLINQKISFDFDYDMLCKTVLEHEIYVRPWGYYKTMVLNDTFQSKVIYILPEQRLSLQSHEHREEYWIIISGNGRVQLGESTHPVNPGDMFFIPKGCKHSISNESTEEIMVFSEVQLGDYFGEDDIKRYSDIYGRK